MGQGHHRRGRDERVSFSRVLRHPEYRYLFRAQLLSLLGDRIAGVAMAVLVFDRTHSALLAAATYAASFLPYLVGGPLLSSLADRMPRRRLMLGADLSRAVLVAVMAIPAVPLAPLFALLLVVSAIQPGFDSARAALVPQMFQNRDEMAVALQLGRLLNQGSQLVGFLAGGAVLAFLSPHGSLALDSATFLGSAILVRAGVRERPASVQVREAFWPHVADGVRLITADSLLRRIVLACCLLNVSLIMPEGLAVTQAHALHDGSATVGLLTAAAPGGYFLALLVVGRLIPPARQFRALRRWAPVATTALIVPLVHPTLVVTLVCWAVAGTANCFQQPANALFVSLVPDSHRGRALGAVQVVMTSAGGLSLLAGGALATVMSVPSVVAIDGVVSLVGLSVALLLWPPNRRTIRLPSDRVPAAVGASAVLQDQTV